MRIGELASTAGVAVDTVRYYEKIGLLPAPARTASGYRVYAAADLKRLKFIRNSKDLGFSLEEIHQLLEALAGPSADRGQVCDLAKARLEEIDSQLKRLKDIRESLHRVVAGCSGQEPVRDCPVTAAVMAHGGDVPVARDAAAATGGVG